MDFPRTELLMWISLKCNRLIRLDDLKSEKASQFMSKIESLREEYTKWKKILDV